MSTLHFDTLLPRTEQAGIYHMPGAAELALSDAAEGLAYPLHRIDLSGVSDKAGFLDAIAKALKFPGWFGHNWDALSDCLCDLSWMPANGYVLVLEHADAFAAGAPADFTTALSVLQGTADNWREQGVPFWTLVGMAADGIAWLPDLN